MSDTVQNIETVGQRAARRSRAAGIDAAGLPLIVGFMLLLAVGGVLVWLVDSSQKQSERVLNAAEIQRSSLRLYRVAQGMESSQRGFLLTGEERYLAPYNAASRVYPEIIETLSRAVKDDPDQAARFATLRDVVARKISELAETIELQRKGQSAEALAVVKSDRGREIMDEIRGLVDAMLAEAKHDVEEEYAQSIVLGRSLLWLTLAALAVIVVLATLAVRTNARAIKAVEASRASAEALNDTLEQAVAERTTELTESNEEIQRFAYIVSHDLRAPLVNVMGFTSELEALKTDLLDVGQKPQDDPQRTLIEKEFKESIGFIKAAIDKMEGLIAAILRLSRDGRRTFQAEPIETTKLVEGLADAQRHQTDAAGATVHVDRHLPALVADRVAMEQIFGNLLDNAIKYLDPARPGRIEVSGETIGTRARISVKDNGRGIAEHDHKRVFELFRRSGQQDRPGEGIGLAHVQTLVRSLGGRITLASELGKGTTFTVVLPLTQRS